MDLGDNQQLLNLAETINPRLSNLLCIKTRFFSYFSKKSVFLIHLV